MAKAKNPLIHRDISWLSFNERVLQEAADPTVPLIERLKFLGIFSNNQDEFFRVRVATLRRLALLGKKVKASLHDDPEKILARIQKTVIKQQQVFEETYQEILRELGKFNIHIIDERALNIEQGAFVRNYFRQKVRPFLVPVMLEKKRRFPYLKDKMIYLYISLNKKGKKSRYAIIEVPTDTAPRFTVLPSSNGNTSLIMLDDIIRYCLDDIFSIFDYETADAYTIKLTRDAELDIDHDINASLVDKLSKSLKKRKKGDPVRLVYDLSIPVEMLSFLTSRLGFTRQDNLIPGGRYHNFKDFMGFPEIGPEVLRYESLSPLPNKVALKRKNIFDTIRKEDILLCYPYQTFDHVVDLLREAAIDPKVETIRITLYRVARNSAIINALVNAARNGKKITVVVELQARFDEENNIYWANNLQEEGVEVIFGVPGLKVHSKLFLITRREAGKEVRYAHIGTGNFHEGTAKIYTDFTLLTADERLTSEVDKLFGFFTDNLKHGTYKHLLISPFLMRRKLITLINKEIKNASEGKEAWITIKVNSLSDEKMIAKLYEASEAGVKVRMIIRGICSMVTGTPTTANVEAISLVDRFLEHARVYHFCNGGDDLLYLSSADWMERNLDYRVEVACPVYDKNIRKVICKVLDLQFKGNVKVRNLDKNQTNPYRKSDGHPPFRAQLEIYRYFREKLIN